MKSIYNKCFEAIGDVFDKSSTDKIKEEHFFVSISDDDSRCVMFTHSTSANTKGKVPKVGVKEWYVKMNYAVGDKRLIYTDAEQYFEDAVITGGGCIDLTNIKPNISRKQVRTRANRALVMCIEYALKLPTLRGRYLEGYAFKDVYNKECYEIFYDSRKWAIKRVKGVVSAHVDKSGILVEFEEWVYKGDAMYNLEKAIETPHYSVDLASDWRSKGTHWLRIGKGL